MSNALRIVSAVFLMMACKNKVQEEATILNDDERAIAVDYVAALAGQYIVSYQRDGEFVPALRMEISVTPDKVILSKAGLLPNDEGYDPAKDLGPDIGYGKDEFGRRSPIVDRDSVHKTEYVVAETARGVNLIRTTYNYIPTYQNIPFFGSWEIDRITPVKIEFVSMEDLHVSVYYVAGALIVTDLGDMRKERISGWRQERWARIRN